MHYGLHEVADIVGLAPGTLSQYSRGYSDLVRGEDFFIQRISPTRRRLRFTERGLYRLKLHAYRVFKYASQAGSVPPLSAGLVQLSGNVGSAERRARVKASVAQAFRAYLEHPCAVPNCPCIIHRLGAPQADELVEYLQYAKPPKPRPMGG